jgi:hypothetical protein
MAGRKILLNPSFINKTGSSNKRQNATYFHAKLTEDSV